MSENQRKNERYHEGWSKRFLLKRLESADEDCSALIKYRIIKIVTQGEMRSKLLRLINLYSLRLQLQATHNRGRGTG